MSSRLYGTEVQFFASYRVADIYAWGRAREGKCERAYEYIGDGDGKVVDIGEMTSDERALGFHQFFDNTSPVAHVEGYWERDDLRDVDEEDVLTLSERWSYCPENFDGYDMDIGPGLLGEFVLVPRSESA